MRICAVQLRPKAGNVELNLAVHLHWVEAAAAQGAELVFFPELSLTGYEPKLARQLAVRPDDSRFDAIQQVSDARAIVIGVGMPLASEAGVMIGMIFFQPQRPRLAYAKQMLHSDELPHFVGGREQILIELREHTIAPAICFESLQPSHVASAAQSGADIYLASVAKPAAGVAKATSHYPTIAQQHSMTVVMANSLGRCDNFISAGQSSAWNPQGVRVASLDGENEGLVVIDV